MVDDDQMAALLDDGRGVEGAGRDLGRAERASAYRGSGQLLLVAGVTGIAPGSRVGNFGDPLDAAALTVE